MKSTEEEIAEHWNQFCFRHRDSILDEAGENDEQLAFCAWHDLPEKSRKAVRSFVVLRLEEWKNS
jgi:hypothetical protein